jgi:hypothetical protein
MENLYESKFISFIIRTSSYKTHEQNQKYINYFIFLFIFLITLLNIISTEYLILVHLPCIGGMYQWLHLHCFHLWFFLYVNQSLTKCKLYIYSHKNIKIVLKLWFIYTRISMSKCVPYTWCSTTFCCCTFKLIIHTYINNVRNINIIN